MKNNFISYLNESFEGVLEKLISEKPVLENYSSNGDNQIRTGEITVLVGITGEIEGRMVFSMGKECATDLAGILLKRKLAGLGEEGKSSISEMCNMVSASLSRRLTSLGYTCDITTPSFFEGKNLSINPEKNSRVVTASYKIKPGVVAISVSMKGAALQKES